MTALIELFSKTRARHIFGLNMLFLAIAIVLRPFGTVVVIADQFGITPTIYAMTLAMSGTVLFLFRTRLWLRWLITIPFVLYLIGTIQLTRSSASRPFTVITIYMGYYLITLYFMSRED